MRKLLFGTLILAAGLLDSCLQPVAPTIPSKIALQVVDSAGVFDTVSFHVILQNALLAGREFVWDFGDGTSRTTVDTVEKHSYLDSGFFRVKVKLVDTASHMEVLSALASIQVGAVAQSKVILIAPDTVNWGDSATMSVELFRPPTGWVLLWSFGDSSLLSTSSRVVSHSYDQPGSYDVSLSAFDTVTKHAFKLQSKKVIVIARSFSWSLLKTFPFVSIECYGSYRSFYSGGGALDGIDTTQIYDTLRLPTFAVTWADSSSSEHYDHSTSSGSGPIDYYIDRVSFDCLINQNATMIRGVSGEKVSHSYDNDNFRLGEGSSSNFSASQIPFESQSDSEMIFERLGNITASAQDEYWHQPYPRSAGWSDTRGSMDFSVSAVPRRGIRIRFHK